MYKIKNKVESDTLAKAIVAGMQENKAEDIVLLDLREIENAVTDFFVICSGNSTTHVEGIVSKLHRETFQNIGEKPLHHEGTGSSEWIVLDYFNVVAHVFYKEVRDHYDLEDLWADAKRIEIKD
jgi:ribosome-associated protein